MIMTILMDVDVLIVPQIKRSAGIRSNQLYRIIVSVLNAHQKDALMALIVTLMIALVPSVKTYSVGIIHGPTK